MGRVRLEYRIPARGLIGFQNEFLNLTRGTGLISNIFDGYEAYKGEIEGRKNGVLISQDDGEAVTYSLGKLDDRGRMFVKAGDPLYEGMIIGIHSRDNDLVVNAVRGKQLTNFRVSRQGRRDQDHAADPAHARIRGRVHRRRRAGRDHAEVDPHAQALPEGARAQEGGARGLSPRRRGPVQAGTGPAGPRRIAPGSRPLRAHCARVTSRWVRARIVRAPSALTQTPRARAAATRAAASGASGARREDDDVGLDRAEVENDARALREAFGEQAGVRMVLAQARQVVLEPVQGGGGEDADLAHRPAEHAAVAQRPAR